MSILRNVYAVFDATGAPQGFYPDDIWEPAEGEERSTKVPFEAVEISQADWNALLKNPWARYENGVVVQYDPPPPEPSPADSVLDALKSIEARLTALEKR